MSTPRPGAELQTRLPILAELSVDPSLTKEDWKALQPLVTKELQACRARHPNSPMLLQVRSDCSMGDAIREAAASERIDVMDIGRARNAGCHFLISASRSHAGPEEPDAGGGAAFDLDPDTPIEAVHIVTANDVKEPTVAFRSVGDARDKNAQGVLKRIDSFNRDEAIITERSRDALANSVAQLAHKRISELGPATVRLADFFSIADTLALHYQRKVKRAFISIFSLGTVAAICYGVFLIYKMDDIALAPYLVVLLAAYLIFHMAKKANAHDRYVDYRGLAEGVRIQFFWSACGLDASAADHYPRRAGELEWIRHSIRAIAASRFAGGTRAGASGVPVRDVLQFWIDDQKRYFETTLAAAKRGLKVSQWAIRGIFFVGVTATGLVLLQARLGFLSPYMKGVSLVSLLAPAIAAAISGYVNKMGYKYQTKHYARMLAIYSRAESQLARAGPKSHLDLALSLGIEALRENGEWALFRRERGIEEPTSPFKKPW